MSLRPLLAHIDRDPTAARLADEGGRAFVSQSIRPYVIAALAERDPRRPLVVVAGDDRSARDLAVELRAWIRPRVVRF
jgi:transcription-repair coupling factor (superfamily II helicase)